MGADAALLLVGHGSRDAAGVAQYWQLAAAVADAAPDVRLGCGFIELVEPDLDTAIDKLVADGSRAIVAVPLVLLGAGHLKNDGPAALARGRARHPGVHMTYGRELGVHPTVLALAEERMRAALAPADDAGIVLVGRGSSDPDANADLYKVARLLQDGRGYPLVEPAFVSLAEPSVPAALERCRRLGARRIAVVPYFLFTGVLVDRIREQAAAWSSSHPGIDVVTGSELGPDPRIAELVLERYREAAAGGARMNCDCCVYRTPLPGHEAKVGAPVPLLPHSHASHSHSHDH